MSRFHALTPLVSTSTDNAVQSVASPSSADAHESTTIDWKSTAALVDGDDFLNALVNVRTATERALAPSSSAPLSKAARMLGSERTSGTRSRSGSVAVANVDLVGVADVGSALGHALAVMLARLFAGASAVKWLREGAAKLRELDDLIRSEYERPDDGREWKALYRRFAVGFVNLLAALEALVRDWHSATLRRALRLALEELQSAGYYVKAFFGGVLVEPCAEQALLSAMAGAKFACANAQGKVAALVPGAPEAVVSEMRKLADAVLELRLVVVILSSVASTREAGDVIGARCQRAHSALGRLEAAISGSQSEAVARKVLVTLRRVADSLDEVQWATQTAVSIVRVRILANSTNVVRLLDVACGLTERLQIQPPPSGEQLRPQMAALSTVLEALRTGLLPTAKVSACWSEGLFAGVLLLAEGFFLIDFPMMQCTRCRSVSWPTPCTLTVVRARCLRPTLHRRRTNLTRC